jgi:Ni,Fe-hydrogenase III large subunit
MVRYIPITTGCGQYNGKQLDFLTDEELKEFNVIGYTRKNSFGVKTDRETYLNSLMKGQFQIHQTKFDTGDYVERFTIVWDTNVGMYPLLFDAKNNSTNEAMMNLIQPYLMHIEWPVHRLTQ